MPIGQRLLVCFEPPGSALPEETHLNPSGDPGTLAPGDIIARKYRLVRLLGEGGTATVWVADNLALETQVAIKILRPALSSNPRIVARVRREAKATAAINHKNVVHVFDYGVTGFGAPFIVMELLRGDTLAQRLKTIGAMRVIDAVRVIARACKGITVAHSKGIIHRDLKPENIFLAIESNGAERPKVLDFGVSFIVRSGEFQSDTTGLTQAGALLGTPAYMAPEAIMGDKPADGRGDVWSLGVILFEMITGRLPFMGTTPFMLMRAVLENTVPKLGEFIPNADDNLQAIIEKALAKDPANRYPGVREFFDDLNSWLSKQEHGLSAPRITTAPLALPVDPLDDDESPTYIGPSLDPNQVRTLRADSDSPLPTRTSPSKVSVSGQKSWPPRPSSQRPSSQRPPSQRPPRPNNSTSSSSSQSGSMLKNVLFALAALIAIGTTMFITAKLVHVAPPPVPPPTATVSATPPSEVQLDILGLPPEATVLINDQKAKIPAMVTRGSVVHVRVEAPGYLPWLNDVSAEGAVKLIYTGTPNLNAPTPAPSQSSKAPVQPQAPPSRTVISPAPY